MTEQENIIKSEEEQKEPTNVKISPDLFQEIISLKEKNIYLFSESFEQKFPEILSYLLEKGDEYPSANKIQILLYLQNLLKKIDFSAGILSKKKSINEQMTLFEVIINQFITSGKDQDYIKELKNTFILLLSKISFERKTYKYIFSFLINHLNNTSKEELDSENVSQILELLNIYYSNIPQIKGKNECIYFNDVSNSDNYLIKIKNKDNVNKKKILNLEDSLNILLFIKLLPNEIIKKEQPNHIMGLLQLNFFDQGKNISFDIDNDYNLIMNNSSKDKIIKLEGNKFINILFRFNLKDTFKIDIYVNAKKIEFKNETQEIKTKENFEINFFKNFFGQCTNIILFKEKKVEGMPKFFTTKQKVEVKQKPKANTISALFDMSAGKQEKVYKEEIVVHNNLIKGLYNEELLNIFLKHELREEVDQNYIDNILKNFSNEKISLEDIKDLYDKIIAIYTPNRFELDNTNENIILKDSISGLDAMFNYKTNKNSDLNGIYLFNNIFEDFNDLGGLNQFIPILEIIINSENLLTKENLLAFLNLVSTLINPYYKNFLKNEKNSNFFSNLSFFFGKIDKKFFLSEISDNIINLSQKLMSLINDDDFKDLIQDFQNFIFDEELFYKYKYQDQKNIIATLNLFFLQKQDLVNIDIMKIINIMLYYDKEKYNKFCCKEHSQFFNQEANKERKIMEPELSEILQPLEYILKSIIKKYSEEPIPVLKDKKNSIIELSKTGKDILSLFSILTLGVSPCLEKSIIKLFVEVLQEKIDMAFKYVNLLDKNGIFFEVCLFILKSAIFEHKSDIMNLINLLVKIKYNLNSENKAKDKEILPSIKINGIYEVYLKNNILPFYLIPKDELGNVDENKIIKSFYGLGGIEFDYLNKSDTEKKIYGNYNKKKINQLMIDLYNNLFQAFRANPAITINLDFLVKIGSKGDLNLVEKFLKDLIKEKNNIKEIYQSSLILNYILETYFQVFMIKTTNYDKNKFVSRFNYLNESDMKKKIEEINNLCKNLINDIFKINVFKLDYLLTWAKYYFEISKNKSNITKELVQEFIYNILSELEKSKSKNEIYAYDTIKHIVEDLYFYNILYELSTFFKLNIIKEEPTEKINLIEDKNIYEELYTSFDSILLNNDNKNQTSVSNKTKWKYYHFFKKIVTYFGSLYNKVMKNENEILKYIENKKNINTYLPEFTILLYDIKEVSLLDPNLPKLDGINEGIKLIYILHHYFILLFNLGGDKEDIKEILTAYKNFMTLIIISASTLSTNIDKKNTKWPKPDDYKNAQIIVKNILYNSFLFLYKSIQKYENIVLSSNDPTNKNYNIYVKNFLYETLAYLLRLTNMIYREARKEEDKKAKKTGVKGFLNKMKNLLIEGEGVKTSGIYFLFEKIYQMLDLNTDYDIKNYLDNIPHSDFNITEKPINNKITECIKAFIENGKNKKLFSLNEEKTDEDIDKSKLYPFISYIKKRNLSLNTFMPLYDVLPNVEFNANEEKNYLLKKVYLVCDYFQKCSYENDLEKNIKNINSQLNKKLLLNMKKGDMEKKTKLFNYIKEKKKMFRFLGLWSYEDYYYNKTKYEIKYKLVNHLTSDYTRVLFEPIINLDYYFPEFTRYNYKEIFRKEENKDIINNLTDLSFAVPEHKKPLINEDDEKKEKNEEIKEDNISQENLKIDEIKTNDDYNELYEIKLNYYKNLDNIAMDNDLTKKNISEELIKDFIIQKYSNNDKNINNLTQYDSHFEACLINSAIHITGLIFNDERGIGFYGYEKGHNKENFEENYDTERFACFGSIFRPNNTKYNNYFIRIPYNSIEFILKRRYFYRRNAIEIFTVDKKSYLFNINENKFKTFYENIRHYMKSNIEDINVESKFDDKIGFYNKLTFLRLNKGYIPFQNRQKDMSLKILYENWSKWKISSMKLLMLLNLYGSRSFHDLNQYPVFPWIITDYESKKLPVLESKEKNIVRSFNTPMGMMDITPEAEERKLNYLETWKSENKEEDEEEENNLDRYRSHYSTSLYTTYYLVRIFPYSYIRVELQGKNFDDPNRLFNSVKSSFKNAIVQKSDLRELIPEFFYLPEMLYNYNKLNLGDISTESGERPCNHVDIPEWANGNGYLFISKHKELLESPEISEKINEWIDIIFGIKQKGKEAKKINNLFVRESYEDYEELYQKADQEKKIYLCKIIEFGVTPSQIFKGDPYKRMPYAEFKNSRQLLPNTTEYLRRNENIFNDFEIDIAKELSIEELNYYIKDIPYKLGYTEGTKGKYRLTAISQDKIQTHKRISNKIQIKKTTPLQSGINSQSPIQVQTPNGPPENKEEDKEILKIDIEKRKDYKLTSTKNRINNSATVFYNNGKNIAFGGYWNGTILVKYLDDIKEEKDKKVKNKSSILHFTGDNSPVVKIVISKNDTYAICGNKLGNIYIFIINQNNKLEWTLYKKISEHRSEITCLDVNEDLNMFISCSKDGFWLSHTLPDCSTINSFKFNENIFNTINIGKINENKTFYPKIALIIYSPLPCVVFYFEERNSLCTFSINGELLIEKKIDFKLGENCIKKYTDMQFNEYLLIFNEISKCIEIYNVVELNSVISMPMIEHTFVDFVVGRELDHIAILVKFKSKNDEKNKEVISVDTAYKILVIRNNNVEFDWN